jgi:hypothetical protein
MKRFISRFLYRVFPQIMTAPYTTLHDIKRALTPKCLRPKVDPNFDIYEMLDKPEYLGKEVE